MGKILRTLPLLFFLLALFMFANSSPYLVQIASASPGFDWRTNPTAKATDLIEWPTSKWTVGNLTRAYDMLLTTWAEIWTDVDGYVEYKTFLLPTVLPSPYVIESVDIHIRYKAPNTGGNDDFRILQYVDPSATEYVLRDWTDGTIDVPLSTYKWTSRPEPNNGSWDWTDISKIRIKFESNLDGGKDNRIVSIYEIWVVVTYYRPPTLCVDPTSQSVSAPFTIDINITNMDDLYSWEFNVSYDTSKITATAVNEGPFLSSGGTTQFNKTIDDANGWAYAYCSLIGHVPGVSGSGVLANITFSLDATGTSTLNLHNTRLVEYDYPSMKTYNFPPYQLTEVDGSVTVTAVVPEFPLGAAMEIALVAVVIYVWWKSKSEPKQPTFVQGST